MHNESGGRTTRGIRPTPIFLFFLIGAVAFAQNSNGTNLLPPALIVSGDLPTTGVLSLEQIQSLASIEVEWSHDNETHRVIGIPLERILTRFGFDSGPHGRELQNNAERRSGWRKVIVASAPDGFQAVFTCAEVFGEIGPSKVLIVWRVDGKPLPPDSGPLRLIALSDMKGSRSIRQLRRLEIVDMRRIVPPMVGELRRASP